MASPMCQMDSPEYNFADTNKAGDAMEWAFLEKTAADSKIATSFVDSGFHDQSWNVSGRSPAAIYTPASSASIEAGKHKWPDTFVWPAKREVIEPGDDLLDSLMALPFDCLRHI